MVQGRDRLGRAGLVPGPLHELGPFVVTFFSVVVVAAGASGAALLVAPGSTERYFSRTLRPPAAAAVIGGFYLASAGVFGWALTPARPGAIRRCRSGRLAKLGRAARYPAQ
jgi:hypothetical protein